ncbi:MAG: calcium/sodium antiporter [Gammaproteobacteria bacterium]|nr:MAG: calcium/sodium antiporter [Gammaproteobacteria bacterium]
MLLYIIGLIVGFALLIYAADKFVLGSARIAQNLGISPLIIGLTIVGFGTSAPEMLVSGFAAWEGNPGLAIGNALGSNITNIALVLGVTALLVPIGVHSKILRRELPVLFALSLICYWLFLDGELSRSDGAIMLTGLFLFLGWVIRTALADKDRADDPISEEVLQELSGHMATRTALLWCLGGLIGLMVASRLLVWAAVEIAHLYEISDLIIGLTIIALGTSLPELAASISSILKKEDDLAIGNIIGSNVYNLLAVLALPGLIHPGAIDPAIISRDFPFMLALTGVLFIMGYGFKGEGRINRLEGGLLFTAFCGYQFLLFSTLSAA